MTADITLIPSLVDNVIMGPTPGIDAICVDPDPDMTALLAEPTPPNAPERPRTLADIIRDMCEETE